MLFPAEQAFVGRDEKRLRGRLASDYLNAIRGSIYTDQLS